MNDDKSDIYGFISIIYFLGLGMTGWAVGMGHSPMWGWLIGGLGTMAYAFLAFIVIYLSPNSQE